MIKTELFRKKCKHEKKNHANATTTLSQTMEKKNSHFNGKHDRKAKHFYSVCTQTIHSPTTTTTTKKYKRYN